MLCVLEAISARVDLLENDGGLVWSDPEALNMRSMIGKHGAGLENVI